jgi:hypothetical protein
MRLSLVRSISTTPSFVRHAAAGAEPTLPRTTRWASPTTSTRTSVLIHLDTYHTNIEEDGFMRPVLKVGGRLGYVHIGENHRGYLGSGHLARGLSNDLAIWRNRWSDGEDLARHARAFIANQPTVHAA